MATLEAFVFLAVGVAGEADRKRRLEFGNVLPEGRDVGPVAVADCERRRAAAGGDGADGGGVRRGGGGGGGGVRHRAAALQAARVAAGGARV